MNLKLRSTHYALAAGIAFLGGAVLAADKDPSEKPDPAMEEMMKKVEAAGAPGKAHAALEPLIGDWNAEVTMWTSPGTPPQTSKGTAKATWALNQRFVQEEFNGEFMGKPFRGLSFTGYDNVRQKYSNVWMDDMSTTTMVSEGVASSDGKAFTFSGDYACAMTGNKHKASRQVIRVLGPDKHVFEMHDPSLGEHSKVMQITYTRR